MRRNFTEKWRNCGWSETQQQHSKHETKRTMIRMTSQPVEFSRKNTKMRSLFAAKWLKLWLEWNSTTTQIARNRNAINNRDKKYEDRLEMFVHNGHVRVVTWRVAAWLFNVGITSCRRINIRHFNNARPFWNKWFIIYMVWRTYSNSKDDF